MVFTRIKLQLSNKIKLNIKHVVSSARSQSGSALSSGKVDNVQITEGGIS